MFVRYKHHNDEGGVTTTAIIVTVRHSVVQSLLNHHRTTTLSHGPDIVIRESTATVGPMLFMASPHHLYQHYPYRTTTTTIVTSLCFSPPVHQRA
jgi:hypothetical protein